VNNMSVQNNNGTEWKRLKHEWNKRITTAEQERNYSGSRVGQKRSKSETIVETNRTRREQKWILVEQEWNKSGTKVEQ